MIKQYFIALLGIITISMQHVRPSSEPYSPKRQAAEESLAQNQKAKELLAFILIDAQPCSRLEKNEIYATVWPQIDSILGTWSHQITTTKPDSLLTQRNEQVMFFIINALILHAHATAEQATVMGKVVDCNNIDIEYYRATINLFLRFMYQTILIKKSTRHRRYYRASIEVYTHHICRLEFIFCNMIDSLCPPDDDTAKTSSESTDECRKIRHASFGFESQSQRLARTFPEYDFRKILSQYYNDGIETEDSALTEIPAFCYGVPVTMA
jgi:hypothetical protein